VTREREESPSNRTLFEVELVNLREKAKESPAEVDGHRVSDLCQYKPPKNKRDVKSEEEEALLKWNKDLHEQAYTNLLKKYKDDEVVKSQIKREYDRYHFFAQFGSDLLQIHIASGLDYSVNFGGEFGAIGGGGDELGLMIIIALVFSEAILLYYIANELTKAIQECLDSHAYTRFAVILASTLVTPAIAASVTAAIYYTTGVLLLGAMIANPTLGAIIALGFVAVALTSLVAFAAKWSGVLYDDKVRKPYQLSTKEKTNLLSQYGEDGAARVDLVEKEIQVRGKRIEALGNTRAIISWDTENFFSSSANKEVRQLKREIYQLRTTGSIEQSSRNELMPGKS
jgi:hypothetical protein